MSGKFPRNTYTSFSQRYFSLRHTFIRHQTTIPHLSTSNLNNTVSKNSGLNINDKFNEFDLELNDLNSYEIFQNSQDRIFQSSEFRSLSLSKHGSLIQDDEIQNIQSDKIKFENSLEFLLDEEELNVNFVSDKETYTKKSKKGLNNSFKYAMQQNPGETKQLKKLRISQDYKVKNSCINEFYQSIIGNEKSIKDFNFSLPQFPIDLNLKTLKYYLIEVNAIDFTYDFNRYENIIYKQMDELLKNINKLDGLIDIEILHQFLKFFSNYPNEWKIFKIITKFEKMGIFPNRNTLHLLIYKLKDIKNTVYKKKILKLYLEIGIEKWKISPDLTTRILIHDCESPSKNRLALAKILINEGVDKSILEWSMYEDYIIIFINNSIEKGNKTQNFEKAIEHLTHLKLIDKKNLEIKRLFKIYIHSLTYMNQESSAINEILTTNKQDLVTTECWDIIIQRLLETKQIWSCFALVNILELKNGIEKRRIIFKILQNYKIIYDFFTKENIKKYNKSLLFCYIMMILQKKIDIETLPVSELINNILESNGPFKEEIYININKEFQNLKFWKSIDDSYNCYIFSLYLSCESNSNFIKRLWRVYDIEDQKIYAGDESIDPLLFPWM
ncbi:hypothetical protein C6P40_002764 [Pichia californica]|uniref:Uncharacterized protein n=1 Tax=Pichia californica TaxID=460514 RepID=A0A9P7BDT0_9ASCO|nr:hypothetical protein C6P40_002764 [[Candida] californica]